MLDLEGVAVRQEFLLEVAKRAGIYDEVRREFCDGINGHTPWIESLERRISLLRGVPRHLFEEIASSTTVNRAAVKFTRALKGRGWTIAVVTGGFDILEETIRRGGLTYDRYLSHKLVFRDDKLWWYELGYEDKGMAARDLKKELVPDLTVAVGDGWNDVGMFDEADLAVGFRPKRAVRRHVDVEVPGFRQLWRLLRLL